jgi:hypothetical protein
VKKHNPMRECVLWLFFFLICLGLGYPTLNRYDPRNAGGLSDTQTYYELVVHGPAAADPQNRYRLLIPWLARPLSRVAAGHIGTWEPVFFGLLIINSFFTATTAYLLVRVARRLALAEPVAILAAALYLLNFETANMRLSGMVDSGEGCFLMAVVWSLSSRRLWPLPLWGALLALSRDTSVPLCIAFTIAWWFASRRHERWNRWETGAILSCGLAALVAVIILHSVVSGDAASPWQFAASLRSSGGHLQALLDNTLDRNLLYSLIWLLPLGSLRLRRLPMPWIASASAAALLTFVLIAWHGSTPGASARPLFSIAGPLLSLSAAIYLGRGFHESPRTRQES